jgi:hypothetical protein
MTTPTIRLLGLIALACFFTAMAIVTLTNSGSIAYNPFVGIVAIIGALLMISVAFVTRGN